MVKSIPFVLFSLVLILVPRSGSESPPIKVSVYYESRCPDSVDFIINQLYPNYDKLKERLLIDFIPYGKANQKKEADGNWYFSCQHGNDECNGNKYQACALNEKKSQDDNVNLVNCIMTLPEPSDADGIKDCVSSNNFNWKNIQTCYEGGKGSELLAAYGDRTHNLSPRLRFVPTVILDNKFDQSIQNLCLRDFVKAVCSKLTEPKPEICKS